MTRLTPWLTAAAITALATAPAAAQQPAPTAPAPQPQQEQTQLATSTQSANDPISKAKLALDGIPKDAVTGAAASKVAEVRRHLAALEKATAKTWATHVTAIDKSITGLMADASLGADVKAKLEEVRTHVTAFAAAKSGTAAAAPAQPPAADPMSTTAATGTTASAGTTGATATQPTTSTMTETQMPPQPPAAQPAAPTTQPDQAAARQHLSEARRVLGEVTQLPAAAQLLGEARTQVAQLITNFNTLITAEADWKEKYTAVEQNLNTLLGTTAGAAVAGTAGSPSATATTGTTGTTGVAGATPSTATAAALTLDPAIKTKLEEFRRHLTAFNAAAGGATIPQ